MKAYSCACSSSLNGHLNLSSKGSLWDSYNPFCKAELQEERLLYWRFNIVYYTSNHVVLVGSGTGWDHVSGWGPGADSWWLGLITEVTAQMPSGRPQCAYEERNKLSPKVINWDFVFFGPLFLLLDWIFRVFIFRNDELTSVRLLYQRCRHDPVGGTHTRDTTKMMSSQEMPALYINEIPDLLKMALFEKNGLFTEQAEKNVVMCIDTGWEESSRVAPHFEIIFCMFIITIKFNIYLYSESVITLRGSKDPLFRYHWEHNCWFLRSRLLHTAVCCLIPDQIQVLIFRQQNPHRCLCFIWSCTVKQTHV